MYAFIFYSLHSVLSFFRIDNWNKLLELDQIVLMDRMFGNHNKNQFKFRIARKQLDT